MNEKTITYLPPALSRRPEFYRPVFRRIRTAWLSPPHRSLATPRHAFTLLEVIIASALLSTLMMVVWSLFSTYTRLEARSSRAATEMQLMRSIAQQLRSDIEHLAIPLPKPKPEDLRQANGKEEQEETLDGATPDAEESGTDSSAETENMEGEQASPQEVEAVQPIRASSVTTASPLSNEITTSLQLDFGEQSLDLQSLNKPQVFDSSLLETMYFRGSATKLEMVIRQPYTVDVPTGDQLLGSETRYGTHQFVIYEWRDARDLTTLLQADPLLNPAKFTPPPPDLFRDPTLPPPAPIIPAQLNPNDNVGLIRESKSWLHITRDQRRNALKQQMETAGLLVDGKPPWELQPQTTATQQLEFNNAASQQNGDDGSLFEPWAPPPEFRHKRDHIPEITKLQFRYFNGESWQLDWTDDTRLPTAVEIAFDVDPDAPAARAKEFEEAHARVLGGAALNSVLPPKEELPEESVVELDSLMNSDILDPTAIITEYRFVVAVPPGPAQKNQSKDEGEQALSFALEENE